MKAADVGGHAAESHYRLAQLERVGNVLRVVDRDEFTPRVRRRHPVVACLWLRLGQAVWDEDDAHRLQWQADQCGWVATSSSSTRSRTSSLSGIVELADAVDQVLHDRGLVVDGQQHCVEGQFVIRDGECVPRVNGDQGMGAQPPQEQPVPIDAGHQVDNCDRGGHDGWHDPRIDHHESDEDRGDPRGPDDGIAVEHRACGQLCGQEAGSGPRELRHCSALPMQAFGRPTAPLGRRRPWARRLRHWVAVAQSKGRGPRRCSTPKAVEDQVGETRRPDSR